MKDRPCISFLFFVIFMWMRMREFDTSLNITTSLGWRTLFSIASTIVNDKNSILLSSVMKIGREEVKISFVDTTQFVSSIYKIEIVQCIQFQYIQLYLQYIHVCTIEVDVRVPVVYVNKTG